MSNKKLTLKPGFHIDDWKCTIEEIHFTKVQEKSWETLDDGYLVRFKDGSYKIHAGYSFEKSLFEDEEKAMIYLNECFIKRKEYYEKQIKDYQQSLKELLNK